ncbi:lytic transglycosylase domain-containing protein [Tatumella sp. JGM118]|uniref:Lytic transglycosylase domain-containing protein n=1 Tax=Tatumella terrea TaxID=419007 RepID=A0ABW1VWU6_9GAMM|nr:lytic transglycosylase domain-containing protein [Tatumella sp. JGM118]MBS0907949.1 lytic transglycosylase domain-containing protein [Tatumella sp. JGM118]
MNRGFLCLLLLIAWQGRAADCFEQAARHYHLNADLLRAISQVESQGKAGTIGLNRDAQGRVTSRDYGLMQINSTHIAALIREHRIQQATDLLRDPCLNIGTGAEILARHLSYCGNNWACLATYNTGFLQGRDQARRRYIHKVYLAYRAYSQQGAGG